MPWQPLENAMVHVQGEEVGLYQLQVVMRGMLHEASGW